MKKNIVKLRMLGIISFLLYILFVMFIATKTPNYTLTQIEELLIIISFGSFAVVMALQAYTFYIKNFVKHNEDDAN